MRRNNRKNDEIRNIDIETGYITHKSGSVMMSMGKTRVICAATIESGVPRFLRGSGQGWVTAEYSMLPASTHDRKARESSIGKVYGRNREIRRMIGRCLRAVVDLEGWGERTVWVDCDVVQADGGTRTASITGAYVALVLAFRDFVEQDKIDHHPVNGVAAAVSTGIVDGDYLLDLNYSEDSNADVDMNIAKDRFLNIIELQGCAEGEKFSNEEMNTLVELADTGIKRIINIQKEAAGNIPGLDFL